MVKLEEKFVSRERKKMSETIKKYLSFCSVAKLIQFFFNGDEEYEVVEEEDWKVEGRHQYATNTFKDKDGVFWSIECNRYGSSFTNYAYEIDDYLTQVEQKEFIVKKWAAVKKEK